MVEKFSAICVSTPVAVVLLLAPSDPHHFVIVIPFFECLTLPGISTNCLGAHASKPCALFMPELLRAGEDEKKG